MQTFIAAYRQIEKLVEDYNDALKDWEYNAEQTKPNVKDAQMGKSRLKPIARKTDDYGSFKNRTGKLNHSDLHKRNPLI